MVFFNVTLNGSLLNSNSYLFFNIEGMEVVVIGELSPSRHILKRIESNTVHSINRPRERDKIPSWDFSSLVCDPSTPPLNYIALFLSFYVFSRDFCHHAFNSSTQEQKQADLCEL